MVRMEFIGACGAVMAPGAVRDIGVPCVVTAKVLPPSPCIWKFAAAAWE
jgi:hypothetical protein